MALVSRRGREGTLGDEGGTREGTKVRERGKRDRDTLLYSVFGIAGVTWWSKIKHLCLDIDGDVDMTVEEMG